MTRNGKIARLPRDIRDELNVRLSNGVPGKGLVEWLNGQREVQFVLEAWFQDRPITEQNLSEWKQGGYQDWLRHQESLEWVRGIHEEAEELQEESGGLPLSDKLSATVALALGKVLRSLLQGDLTNAEQRSELLPLMRELADLREGDHRATRLRMDYQSWEAEQEAARNRRLKAEKHDLDWEPIHDLRNVLSKELALSSMISHLSPEAQAGIRAVVRKTEASIKGYSVTPIVDPTKSDPIQPDPAKRTRAKKRVTRPTNPTAT